MTFGCDKMIVSSNGHDPAKSFFASSPYRGDMGCSGLLIPRAATKEQDARYLFRLAAITIPNGCYVDLHSLAQYLSIGADIPVDPQDAFSVKQRVELQVHEPMWEFSDANVAWMLMLLEPMTSYEPLVNPDPSLDLPGAGTEFTGTDSTLLWTGSPGDYVPPAAGQPLASGAARGIGQYQMFHDLRFPWSLAQREVSLGIKVNGPGQLVFYASVRQTNPEERQASVLDINDPATLACVPREDIFVARYPLYARYYRIAGELIADIVRGDCESCSTCPA